MPEHVLFTCTSHADSSLVDTIFDRPIRSMSNHSSDYHSATSRQTNGLDDRRLNNFYTTKNTKRWIQIQQSFSGIFSSTYRRHSSFSSNLHDIESHPTRLASELASSRPFVVLRTEHSKAGYSLSRTNTVAGWQGMCLLGREVSHERLRHRKSEENCSKNSADERHGNVRSVTQPTGLRIQIAVENQFEQTKPWWKKNCTNDIKSANAFHLWNFSSRASLVPLIKHKNASDQWIISLPNKSHNTQSCTNDGRCNLNFQISSGSLADMVCSQAANWANRLLSVYCKSLSGQPEQNRMQA